MITLSITRRVKCDHCGKIRTFEFPPKGKQAKDKRNWYQSRNGSLNDPEAKDYCPDCTEAVLGINQRG